MTERLTTYPQDAFASSPDARTGEVRIASGASNSRRPVSTGTPLASTDLLSGPVRIVEPEVPLPPFEIGVSPRIGIRRAADLPYRFFVRGNPYLSRRG